jgi:hypothetical protein
VFPVGRVADLDAISRSDPGRKDAVFSGTDFVVELPEEAQSEKSLDAERLWEIVHVDLEVVSVKPIAENLDTSSCNPAPCRSLM